MILETGRIYRDNKGDDWRCVRPNIFRAELMWCHIVGASREDLFFLSGLGYTTEQEGRHLVRDVTDIYEADHQFNNWYENGGYLADRL